MKNKKVIILAVLIFILMLIPIPIRLKDGGSVEYKAIMYKYTKIHRLNEASSTGYEDGWKLKIFGINVGGETNITIEALPIKVVKAKLHNSDKFNIYLERNGRIIYLSSNLEDVYYYNVDVEYTLENYITNTWQTMDDSIKHLTDILDNTETLRDGGTKVFKSKKYDITVITCNTVSGNKDIFIGEHDMAFDSELMCRR